MDRKTGEAKVTFDISRTFRVPYALIFFRDELVSYTTIDVDVLPSFILVSRRAQ